MATYAAFKADELKKITVGTDTERKALRDSLKEQAHDSYYIVSILEEVEVGEPKRTPKTVVRTLKTYNTRAKK
jgi:hypothetical protein